MRCSATCGARAGGHDPADRGAAGRRPRCATPGSTIVRPRPPGGRRRRRRVVGSHLRLRQARRRLPRGPGGRPDRGDQPRPVLPDARRRPARLRRDARRDRGVDGRHGRGDRRQAVDRTWPRRCWSGSRCRRRTRVLVGDRLQTDVRMAHEAGMASALVLSGATPRSARSPDARLHARLRPGRRRRGPARATDSRRCRDRVHLHADPRRHDGAGRARGLRDAARHGPALRRVQGHRPAAGRAARARPGDARRRPRGLPRGRLGARRGRAPLACGPRSTSASTG